MTTTALLPDAALRYPYWLSREDRSALAETIVYLTSTVAMFPAARTALDAVLLELGVAEARNQMWPDRVELARNVNGHPEDHLPIRMSEAERDTVLGLTLIPDTVRDALNPPTQK